MKSPHLGSDKSLLIRQAIAAWVVLTTSVVVFVVVALVLHSRIIPAPEMTVIVTFLLVTPFLIGAHLVLYRRGYHFRKPSNKHRPSLPMPPQSPPPALQVDSQKDTSPNRLRFRREEDVPEHRRRRHHASRPDSQEGIEQEIEPEE